MTKHPHDNSRSHADRLRSLFALALVVTLGTACSSKKVMTPADYLRAGDEAISIQDYEYAVQQYDKLLEEHPFSEFTEQAQLKVAHAFFLDKRYPEAISAFQDFQRMYPTSDEIPFSEFHIGLSYVKQMSSVDRDQRASANAHAHFQILIDRYPDSEYADKAREELYQCRVSLAEHELHIANFYATWENPIGAESRLRFLLTKFSDTEVAATGLLQFARWFRERGDLGRAALAYRSILAEYPTSEEAEDAKSALDSLGDLPGDDGGDPLLALLDTLGRKPAES